ncbi:MAG: ABC transporter permease [Dehalococcoidia bacterium]|nr:ABC transporter permease [Dehalococcoidia bacterium]
MSTYIARRLVLIIPTLLLVTIIVFLTVRFVPGSLIDIMTSQMAPESDLGGKTVAEYIKHVLGLDVPVHVQYARWLSGVVRGDLGRSLWTDRSITREIVNRIPISLELGIMAIITSLLIAIPIGIYSAIRQDTSGDYIGRSFAILCIAVPGFWLGTIVMVFPAVWWGWSPPVEYTPITKDFGDNFIQFIIPSVIMGMVMSGTTMRMSRTMMLEVLRQDYIKTAWSKGLKERAIVVRHAMKNAMIPVVTIIGLQIPVLIGGSVIMEQIFNLPGIGRLMIEALNQRDYPVISGVNVVMGTAVLVVNLLVDIVYAYLDPRISYR